ncbi:MAG TPA: hypothetical protein ENH34_06595 [Phycisphaerales bacterium]|nr:hypothetical protein [Phycisphaerales bacterium]
MSKKLVLLIFSSLLCFVYGGCSVNPVTGESQLNLFGSDIRNDVSLGRQWSPQLEKEFGGVVENVSLGNYVNYVGLNIAQAGHAPNLEWHFKVLRHNSVNAFALPGGYIYITTGMLKKLNSEAQLAGVLAHESVHVTARHTTVRMSEQIGLDILLSSVISEDTQRGLVQATSVVRRIVALKYSRDDERQADTAGLGYMVKAGYNPYGMVETMQMLAEENMVRPIEFLSSHPAPQDRREYLAQKIQTNYYYNLAGLKIGKEDYRRAVLEQLNN